MPDTNSLLSAPVKIAKDKQTNATATATATAPSNNNNANYIYGIQISCSAQPTTAVEALVKSGTTTLFEIQLPANIGSFPSLFWYTNPIRCNNGELASVTVPALGVGIVCSVELFYLITSGS